MRNLKLFCLAVFLSVRGAFACSVGSRGYAQYSRGGTFLDANIVRFDGTSYWLDWVHDNSLCSDTGYSKGNEDLCLRFSWQVKDLNGRVCGANDGSSANGGSSNGKKEDDDSMGTFMTIGIVVISVGLAGCIFVTTCMSAESDEAAQARLENSGGRRGFRWSSTMSGSFSRSLSRSFSFKKMGSFFTRQQKYESRIAHIDDAPQVVKFVNSDDLVKKMKAPPPARKEIAPTPHFGIIQGRAKRVTTDGTLENSTFASGNDMFSSTQKPFRSKEDRRHTVF